MELLEGEVFKPLNVEGYEKYLVSNKGRVWNGKIFMKHFYTSDGYKRLSLTSNGLDKKFTIHRMVALTFLGKPDDEKLVVNHKDSNRVNNDVDNLEWVTIRENVMHAVRSGGIDVEKLRNQAKFANQKSCEARRRKVELTKYGISLVFGSLVEAEDKTGLCRKALGSVARGERNHHKGYQVNYL